MQLGSNSEQRDKYNPAQVTSGMQVGPNSGRMDKDNPEKVTSGMRVGSNSEQQDKYNPVQQDNLTEEVVVNRAGENRMERLAGVAPFDCPEHMAVEH